MDVVRAKVAATPTPASVEESRDNRIQRLKSRFRDRGGIFQPTGENKLVSLLLAHRTLQQRRSRSRSLSPVKTSKVVKGKKAKKQAEDESVTGPSTVKGKSKTKAKPKPKTETRAKRRGRPAKASVDEPPPAKPNAKTPRSHTSTAAPPPDNDSEDVPLSKAVSRKPHTTRPPPMTPIQEADEEEDADADAGVVVFKGKSKALSTSSYKARTPSKARTASKVKYVDADEDAAVDMPLKGSRAGSSKLKAKVKVKPKAVEELEVAIKTSAVLSAENSGSVAASSKLGGKSKTVKNVDQGSIDAPAEQLGKPETSQAAKLGDSSSKSKAKARAVGDVEVSARKPAKASTKVRKAKGDNEAQPVLTTSSLKLKSDDQARAEKPPPKAKRPRADEDGEVGGDVGKKPRVEELPEKKVATKKRKVKEVLDEVNVVEKVIKRSKTSKSLVVQDDGENVKVAPNKRTPKLKKNVQRAPKRPTVKKGPRKSVVARLHDPVPLVEDGERDPIDFLS
ncbi:uncharacterized protein BT62DRAFT_80185 [Guyanagaster necrorhizus]|uniref:Uncharacterized protein n=1 Tax=Guyanagaster necrorhizus TaxID=856835 RepID=A0A9P7VU16_9AGAR|nr:uncharacterized protein BT62DRAFT_80185 [Guyanagaster necrorhizus MCA 3950]KAG7447388.1 hypothetical protein BT62DRAFT_80185 [Guyanagaster necrorhizus MCA 3950]